MHITLNGRTFDLKSLNRKQMKKLNAFTEIAEQDAFWSEILLDFYGLSPEDIDKMTARDVALLCRATQTYSMGMKRADIKNFVVGDDGDVTSSDSEPAETA